MISLSASASLASSSRPRGLDDVRAAGEQHLGLEHEPVADDPHVRAVAQGLAQLAEELRAVLRQLLDLARQRDVEPLAEIGDGVALRVDLRLLEVERLVQGRELLAQRRDLLGQHPHLLHRIVARAGGRRRAWPRGPSSCAAAPRSADRAPPARAAPARSSGRRRRAAPPARWPGRGSSPARPAARRSSSVVERLVSSSATFALELGAHPVQGLDVAPQLDQLAELQLDLLPCRPDRCLARRRARAPAPSARTSPWPPATRISSSVRCINA